MIPIGSRDLHSWLCPYETCALHKFCAFWKFIAILLNSSPNYIFVCVKVWWAFHLSFILYALRPDITCSSTDLSSTFQLWQSIWQLTLCKLNATPINRQRRGRPGETHFISPRGWWRLRNIPTLPSPRDQAFPSPNNLLWKKLILTLLRMANSHNQSILLFVKIYEVYFIHKTSSSPK